jgi:hypothetical protein
MEEGFAVSERDLNIGLLEGWWDGIFGFRGDLGDENRRFAMGLGHGL